MRAQNSEYRGGGTDAAGFTIVELVVVMCIVGVLIFMATLQFNSYSLKSGIEGQIRELTAELTSVRSEALFERRSRAVTLSSTTLAIYSSAIASGSPVRSKTMKYPMVKGGLPTPLVFNGMGMMEGVSSGAAVCIEPAGNAGTIDSILINTTRLQTGKRNGTNCQAAGIEIK